MISFTFGIPKSWSKLPSPIPLDANIPEPACFISFFKDFYDGMEEMRESYGDNVAFLYISDDMKWGRKNLKDKENDLYFVGLGNTNGE